MNTHLSYWELKEWLTNIDFTVVGSGIVGLNCALSLKEKYPQSNIIILEKGVLPSGASTKNAGFACFGSISELLDDLKAHSEEEIFQLAGKRWEGLQRLRRQIGDITLAYQQHGGYELFLKNDEALIENCFERINYFNELLQPIFKKEVFITSKNRFSFNNVYNNYILNRFEGQLDTGKMMKALLQKAIEKKIKILNGITVNSFSEDLNSVKVQTNHFDFSSRKLFIATNGFASQLGINDVSPARAQVLITKPIEKLQIKGTFHLDKGYYYFRNIDNRILLGGGRNLALKEETTTTFGQTSLIQDKLEALLKTAILPKTSFEIEHRWSGIMGIGSQKKPIVKTISNNVFCGVRLGGMGVAIGAQTGAELAELANA
ncbi:FAD-dependent oxidoreductase [Leptobacterium sp. I13]|uniref:NAD(P)/FAD-dependent oxidoreductase n=1 Tax=Leptobacterium meishanense TaxID=3128904 RepID=UPI0030EC44CA